MKHCWEHKIFEDCLEKVVYTTKVLSKDYLENGTFPIVSQEDGLISGYWNNENDLFHIKKPIVVFGDHTRVLKYIDFDFVIGADGVKILQPIDTIQAKYLFYYLCWYNVPSLGYSRHYKLLKEINLPVPPIEEQKAICAELDALSLVIEKKKEQIKQLDNLAQSIFYDTFGDPATNKRNFTITNIGKIAVLKSGNSEANNSMEGDLPYVKVGDMNISGNENYITTSSRFVDRLSNKKNIFPKGTIIFPKRGGAIGTNKKRLCKVDICCDLNTMGVIPDKGVVEPLYVFQYFKNIDLGRLCNGATIPQINNGDIAPLKILLPPLSLQQTFAERIEGIERQKELINQSIREVQTLFDSRMDYYFRD